MTELGDPSVSEMEEQLRTALETEEKEAEAQTEANIEEPEQGAIKEEPEQEFFDEEPEPEFLDEEPKPEVPGEESEAEEPEEEPAEDPGPEVLTKENVPVRTIPATAPVNEEPEEDEDEPAPKKKKGLIALIVVLICAAALFAVYAVFCYKGSTRDIDTQYTINGINVTSMTADEAQAAIQKQFEDDYSDSSYQVQVEDKSYNIAIFPYLAIDASKEIAKSQDYDMGPFLSRGLKYIQSLVSSAEYEEYTVIPYLADEKGLEEAAKKVGEAYYIAPVDGTWNENGSTITITAGKSGRSIDYEKICDGIASGIEKQQYSGTVVSDVILTAPKNVDTEAIASSVYLAAEDASYHLENNELVVTESKQGKEVSAEELKKQLDQAEEGSVIRIEETPIEPAVTADYLNQVLLADRLSGYAVVDGGSWTQINNQSIAAEAINGAIVMPGEVFSFNDLVGDTTPDKGYVEDYAYENNKLVTMYGGGVCRVASTLYAAVLYTNLEVIERNNHTSPVHYLPYGMDATVSYPEPDLKFLNNRKYPIRVELFLGDDDYLHAAIYGTREEGEPYVDVELDFENDMLVHTYRYYYTEEGGDLLYTEFMHTSSYVELQQDPTPTPTPTPSPEQTDTPQETQSPEETQTPEEQQTPEETPAPEEPQAPEGGEGSEEG